MHIVLGILGAAITILILIRRLGDAGITLDSFNPFAWYRRHQWMKKYHKSPLFNIEDPMALAGMMLVAVAKSDGLIALEEKQAIIELFETEFELSANDAAAMFTSSAFFLKDEMAITPNMKQIVHLAGHKFSVNQLNLTIQCMQKIAALSNSNHSEKQRLIDTFKQSVEAKMG